MEQSLEAVACKAKIAQRQCRLAQKQESKKRKKLLEWLTVAYESLNTLYERLNIQGEFIRFFQWQLYIMLVYYLASSC